MHSFKTPLVCCILSLPAFLVNATGTGHIEKEDRRTTVDACAGFGPQTPRDIDNLAGTNKRMFSLAPDYRQMNLCNMHFHQNAEHKAKDFSIFAGVGDDGQSRGYQCQISQSLSKAELKPTKTDICHGLKPGATIEVHWVHSSCNTTPGEGLGACATGDCVNPSLRVETQVFTVVNDRNALDFNDFDLAKQRPNGYYQAKTLPNNTGKGVEFTGSTTGPSYSNQKCSAYEVSWNVRPQCAKVDINSLGKWCKNNAFKEGHAHGVRQLVIDVKKLSAIK